jgi:hypothetical protein
MSNDAVNYKHVMRYWRLRTGYSLLMCGMGNWINGAL